MRAGLGEDGGGGIGNRTDKGVAGDAEIGTSGEKACSLAGKGIDCTLNGRSE